MSEFYDQDLEPQREGNLKHWVFWILFLIIAAGAYGYLWGFYGTSNQGADVEVSRDVASYRSQDIDWAACDESMFVPVDWRDSKFDASAAQYGEFAVPATYSSIIGRDLSNLSIKVLRTPALDQENKLGTLFFNPGGPGGSGINLIQSLMVPDEIRQKYDLVGFDPRGVGKSSPVKCSDSDSIDYYFATVSSPEN